MAISFKLINTKLARRIKLVVADVDGTLTTQGDPISLPVKNAVRLLVNQGISVGLVSGRDMNSLNSCALELAINGPIIAENGGQVKLSYAGAILNFSRKEIVRNAWSRLKNTFGEAG